MNLRQRTFLIALLLAAIVVLLSSACMTNFRETKYVTFVLARHAEVTPDGTKNPSLSDAGRARARALGASLQPRKLTAIYATNYRRTQETARIVLDSDPSWKMPVTTYDAALPAQQFARQLRSVHTSGEIVIIGHSNTIPAIAAALCQCEIAAMREDEFDRRIVMNVDTLARRDAATVWETRY